MADPNTRQGKRTPVTLKIKFKSETLEQFIERYAVDVSQGGIFIRTKEPLAVGTQMRFEFQLRDASPLIAGDGTVVWTRENDPSRPAIAPGMGVRFDRLADGSQTVLERILSEKAKQAPQRGHGEATKPPLFTDTPTRVAPAPVQEALLGNDSKKHRGDFGEQHTPLPKPMPFHSDADEFPDEAFEEATKVRALDDLIAQTADGGGSDSGSDLFQGKPPDELAARRGAVRADSTLADPPAPLVPTGQHLDHAGTSPGFASGKPAPDRESAPSLPSPPESSAPLKAPRLLDTSPSPRTDDAAAADAKAALIAQNARMEKLAKTKIGMEPAHVATRSTQPTPAPQPVLRDAPTRPSGNDVASQRRPIAPEKPKGSKAPLVILLLVLLAAGGAGVWFFVFREKVADNGKGSGNVATNPGSGSNKEPGGSGSDGSAAGAGTGSAPVAPKGPLVDIEITSVTPKATIEVVDTAEPATFRVNGPSPLKAKLEKDKVYKVRVMAPGHATLEQEVTGGKDKWAAKLDPKPHVITVSSEPAGALIFIDGVPAGKVTPFDVELTKVQAARKSVRVGLRKGGFRPVEKLVSIETFTEDPSRMMARVDERLAVQIKIPQQPRPGSGSGSAATGSAEPSGSGTPPPAGSGTPTPGSGTPGSGTPGSGTPGSGTPGSGTPGSGSGGGGSSGGGTGGGSAKEPEPEFVKPNP